jgi:TRAP-type C4-dicarboxylate transport system substrate-binding protein
VQQRFYEVARCMARTRHIAGVLGLFASTAGMARIPLPIRGILAQAAHDAAVYQRTRGPQEDSTAVDQLTAQGMIIRDLDRGAFRPAAERLWSSEGQSLGVLPWLEAIRG